MAVTIISTLKPQNNGDFGVAEDTDIVGGYRVVEDDVARNAIPYGRRKVGMKAYVVATQTSWRLSSRGTPGEDLTEEHWLRLGEESFSAEPPTAAILTGTSVVIDFDRSLPPLRLLELTGDTTFTGVNYGYNGNVVVHITGDSVDRTVTLPAGWVPIGTMFPPAVPAGRAAVLSLSCGGTTEQTVFGALVLQAVAAALPLANQSPADGATTNNAEPPIVFTITQEGGAVLDYNLIDVTVAGSPAVTNGQAADGWTLDRVLSSGVHTFTLTSEAPLAPGAVAVIANYNDTEGTTYQENWSFSIAAGIEPFDPAPLAYWRFEETYGTTPPYVADIATVEEFTDSDISLGGAGAKTFVPATVGNALQFLATGQSLSAATEVGPLSAFTIVSLCSIQGPIPVPNLATTFQTVWYFYPANSMDREWLLLSIVRVTDTTFDVYARISIDASFTVATPMSKLTTTPLNVDEPFFAAVTRTEGGVLTGFANAELGVAIENIGVLSDGALDVGHAQSAFRASMTLDEMAVFNAALTEQQLADLRARWLAGTPLM